MPERETTASCYGSELVGSLQANGEPFNPSAHTTAHRWLPFGSKILVKAGDSWAILTVTDRGPFVEDREFDFSCGAMQALGLPIGVHLVRVVEL
jgi:rare lipoprotein A